METHVAKGQQKSNREIRKPKQTTAKGAPPKSATVSNVFAKPAKASKR